MSKSMYSDEIEQRLERIKLEGELPTKAEAHLALIEAAQLFAGRQTDASYERLFAAVITAKLMKLY